MESAAGPVLKHVGDHVLHFEPNVCAHLEPVGICQFVIVRDVVEVHYGSDRLLG